MLFSCTPLGAGVAGTLDCVPVVNWPEIGLLAFLVVVALLRGAWWVIGGPGDRVTCPRCGGTDPACPVCHPQDAG
jgi:hypothetical protein